MSGKLSRRSTLWQVGFVTFLAAVAYLAVQNVRINLDNSGVALSFHFLSAEAGFDISDSLIPITSTDTYGRVIWAGILNTLLLSAVCISGATVVGTIMGLLRTSGHYLGEKVAYAYIELMRNLPKLLILLALYVGVINALPIVRQSWTPFGEIQISNRAIYFPVLESGSGTTFLTFLLLAWVIALLVCGKLARALQARTGRQLPVVWPITLLFFAVFLASFLIPGISYPVSHPELRGFEYGGGGRLSIQFVVLVGALSIYHGGQVAELVRGAIKAVPVGQFEAARAYGLSHLQLMRLVVLPQALRVIIPPMGNQYLNITKNTSIAIAVGYSDLVSVMTTSINQTFRPIELMTLSMCVYLAICLAVSAAVNFYNARVNLGMRK